MIDDSDLKERMSFAQKGICRRLLAGRVGSHLTSNCLLKLWGDTHSFFSSVLSQIKNERGILLNLAVLSLLWISSVIF